MTFAGYDLASLVTLITIVFGALTFSVLAVFYWREHGPRGRSPFAAFTAACAAAFTINLALRILPSWETPLTVALDLAAGVLPPLLLHVVLGRRRSAVPVFYAIGLSAAVWLALDDLDILSSPIRDQLPAVMLGTAAVLGLILLRVASPLQLWYRWLLVLTAAVAGASLVYRSAFTILAPDYLLLAFFCVTLYYQERLIFFDLLIKRGAFFGAALAAITGALAIARIPNPAEIALALTALFLLAPWADAILGSVVDRVFLRRRYSAPQAERLFLNELQLAASEDDLRARAERCLSDIFNGAAAVRLGAQAPREISNSGELTAPLPNHGWVIVQPRRSGISFMSDDRRLFDSLARTLAVVVENVRFREQQQRQQDREQQLRLLASRAELKALRAQIDPHFLFNALNAIAGLIPAQPALADHTVEELAQVFRYTLRRSENEWVRLQEEAEFVGAYLRVEQARFGDRLRVEIAIEPDAAVITIPAMCIQPLVENAVKHGASQTERGGMVGLRGALDGPALRLEVYDNGPGFPAGFSLCNSAGHGLRNVAERLRGYYGEAAELSWNSDAGMTRVWLRLPAGGTTVDTRSYRG
jgi:Histidine kinase